MTKFLSRALSTLKTISMSLFIHMVTSHIVMGIISPVVVTGVNWGNIIYWSLVTSPLVIMSYYIGTDWTYVFGSWFIGKYHLDMQAQYMIDKMERLLTSSSKLNIYNVYTLDVFFKGVVKRAKKFNTLSTDLISPYRLCSCYICGIAVVAAHKTDNLGLQFSIYSIALSFYVVSLIFMSTVCTLSTRRKKLYLLANQTFIKVSRERTSLTSLVILRRMIKSLANHRQPVIALKDKSGQEFAPMEFVEFVFETMSNFMLAATVYNDFIK
jgi:hypothetical protein